MILVGRLVEGQSVAYALGGSRELPREAVESWIKTQVEALSEGTGASHLYLEETDPVIGKGGKKAGGREGCRQTLLCCLLTLHSPLL